MTTYFPGAGAISILRKTFGNYKKQAVLLVFLGLASGLFEGVGIGAVVPLLSFLVGGEGEPNIVSKTIESGFQFFSIPFTFATVTFFIVTLFFARAGVLAISTYMRAWIGADFRNKEMTNLFGGALRSEWGFLVRQKAGYIQTSTVRDVQMTASLFDVFAQTIQSFTGFLMYFAVAVGISSRITAYTILVGAVLLLFLYPLVKKTRTIGEKTIEAEKNMSELLTEYLFGLKTVKTAGKEEEVLAEGKGFLETMRRLYTKNAFVHSMGTIFIQPIGFLLIIVIFYFAYHSPNFNIVVFGATIYLIQKIFSYLESGQNALHSVNQYAPYASNILSLKKNLSMYEESKFVGGNVFLFNNTFKAENVSFSYKEDAPALHNVSFEIKRGETVGLIGPSGSGKTTLADMILRLFKPNEGKIFIDGKSIEDINLREWRSNVGYVSQDLFLVDGTVEENIRFYNVSLSDSDVRRAAKDANIADVIEKLPDGYQTLIGDRGLFLSAGQRQRIVLARVLATRPKILVLDEATSALDNETEQLVHKAIEKLHGDITVLIIAHRLSTVLLADRVMVLDAGKIEEIGKPKELLEDKTSYFYRLYHTQTID